MFTTKVQIEKQEKSFNYETNFLTLGSCFSENIGKKLDNAFFDVEINPLGVMFNPLSILNALEFLMDKKVFTEQDLFNQGSLWRSFNHSTLFSSEKLEITLENINTRMESAIKKLPHSNVLLITFGTAWVYERIQNGETVANCHKLPSTFFKRRRISIEEIVEKYNILIQKIKKLYPNLQFIFTVSPIRHWKDGAHENNLSKSILHLAIEELQKQFDHVHYFPAYEIQMDELRDYRYYANDMFHPSDLAIDYIWKRFTEAFFDTQTLALIKKLENLSNQLNHRPIHIDTKEYVEFLQSIETQKNKLKTEHQFLKNRL